jgi:hypothetical protein
MWMTGRSWPQNNMGFFRSQRAKQGGIVEPQAANESVQQTEPIKPQSFLSRLGGVYTSPRETFKEIGRSPGVLVPIIVLIILAVLVSYLAAQRIDMGALAAEQMERFAESGRIPAEQLDMMKQRAASQSKYGSLISGPIVGMLIVLVIAGIAKLVSVLLGAGNRFKALLAVTLYAMIAVSIIDRALYLLILYLKDPADLNLSTLSSLVASNLGSWISGLLGEDALPKYAMALARYVDIFAIAKIALLAIGYSAVSVKLKTGTAAVWLVAFYIIVALIGSAIGSLFGM